MICGVVRPACSSGVAETSTRNFANFANDAYTFIQEFFLKERPIRQLTC